MVKETRNEKKKEKRKMDAKHPNEYYSSQKHEN